MTISRFTLLVSILGIVIPTGYFVFMYRSPKTTRIEKSRLIVYIPLIVCFWVTSKSKLNVYVAELKKDAIRRPQLGLMRF
ncbi:hypothetical protein COI66_29175 [Bacillus toyonensis]|nr:hypothetical protein COI66_29175 [Bacillus toyonensis]